MASALSSAANAIAYEHYFTAKVGNGEWVDGVVMYDVEVNTNLPEYGVRVIKVVKRFSEFSELHRALKPSDPQMPSLPGKGLFTTENTIRQRSVAFEAFLNYIGRNRTTRVSPDVRKFLYMFNRGGQRIQEPGVNTPESVHTINEPRGVEKRNLKEDEMPRPPGVLWRHNPQEGLVNRPISATYSPAMSSVPVNPFLRMDNPPTVDPPPANDATPPPPSASSSGVFKSPPLAARPKPKFQAFDFNFCSPAASEELTAPTSEIRAHGEGLREAVKSGQVEVVQAILAKSVDPNYSDQQKMSVLHLAALFGQSEIAMILMEAGARVDVKNSQGETPIDVAQVVLARRMQEKAARLAAGGAN
mmetsp:Transcript_10622/g.18225  ORF Transcript_10622/g.18225 Transcript_10622/m.18225 type:complete len:359 (-) Transcript_10622:157-1233(-)|eukprot:CAMPEP_0198197118 /NCGR_PEP_ID=MMETSP1445-20131203/704_1 /TAXON_ID=36898 /ORGANISM="Pyramimonas sp., Strain CCMP2087" /LENGTH=358 /DNA_ID=CAMNT_0043866283 /DNA_START=255 /DNA_END=1331 /DNA_ORIENTATION=-